MAGRCASCHLNLARYGSKPLGTFTHGGDFVREHMRPARAAPETCATCHDQTFCSDCHSSHSGPAGGDQAPRARRPRLHSPQRLHLPATRLKSSQCGILRELPWLELLHDLSHCPEPDRAGNQPTQSAPAGLHASGLGAVPRHRGAAGHCELRVVPRSGLQSNCVTCHKVGGMAAIRTRPATSRGIRARRSPATECARPATPPSHTTRERP